MTIPAIAPGPIDALEVVGGGEERDWDGDGLDDWFAPWIGDVLVELVLVVNSLEVFNVVERDVSDLVVLVWRLFVELGESRSVVPFSTDRLGMIDPNWEESYQGYWKNIRSR